MIYIERRTGLICAFDLPSEEHVSKMKGIVYDKGALLLSCGSVTIRFRPVLDCTMDAVDQMISILDSSLQLLSALKASL
jgi:L-lysine 6-transaminase